MLVCDMTMQSRSRVQNMLPCTTAQILMAQQRDDKFFMDDIELHQVSPIAKPTQAGRLMFVSITDLWMVVFIDLCIGVEVCVFGIYKKYWDFKKI